MYPCARAGDFVSRCSVGPKSKNCIAAQFVIELSVVKLSFFNSLWVAKNLTVTGIIMGHLASRLGPHRGPRSPHDGDRREHETGISMKLMLRSAEGYIIKIYQTTTSRVLLN